MSLTIPYRSIPDMFLQRVAATPDTQALRATPRRTTPDRLAHLGAGRPSGPRAIAAGLRELGVGQEDRVAILASTRVEWLLADFGIMCAGAATTTVYPTTEPEDAVFILARLGVEGADRGERRRRSPRSPAPTCRPDAHRGDRRRGRRGAARTRTHARGAGAARRRRARRRPGPGRPSVAGDRAGPPGHADLHLRHHRPAQGRRAAARRLVLGGRRAGATSGCSAPTTCSTCGCRCRTRSARR